MQTHRSYNLESYNPDWPSQFSKLANTLRPIFDDSAIRIEHIGSTSIPGMSAKPQIDIMVEVRSLDAVREVYEAMEAAGFAAKGDYGGSLENEEYFTKDSPSGERLASVHVYEVGHPKVARNLKFRDYLRTHPDEARRYERTKLELFNKYTDDYPAYNRAKEGFITEINRKSTLIETTIPDHRPGKAPDHEAIGNELDEILKKYFLGSKVVIRCIGSQDHPNTSLDDLADRIIETGTDKYDTNRMGVGYEEFVKKGIKVDLYGEPTTIVEDAHIMPQALWEMHHSAIGDRGFGVHVDLVLVYDASKLDMVMNLYSFHPTSDGYVFKDQDNKADALLGLIKIKS